MKSALAAGIIAASVACAAAQQQQQQRGAAAQYKKMTQLRGVRGGGGAESSSGSTTAGVRRRGLAGDDQADLSTCSALGEQASCNSSASCSWCRSGAVPSACYPSALTSRLPPGVFECDGGEAEVEEKDGGAANVRSFVEDVVGRKEKRVETFNLKEGVTLTMSSGEVDKNFCDASSPLSLAGYMDGEFEVKLAAESAKAGKNRGAGDWLFVLAFALLTIGG